MKLAILLAAAAAAAPAKDVTFDSANVLHPAMGAEYRVAGRDVELKFGSVTYHLRNSGAPPVRIAAGSVSVEPYFAGDYKVEVKRSGEVEITPQQGGSVRVVAAGGTEWVAVGNKMIVRGGGPNPQYRIVSAVSRWSRLATALANINFGAGVAAGGGSDDSSSSSAPSHSGSGGHSAPASPTTHAASEAAHSAAASSTAHAAAATSSGGHGK